MGAALDLMAAVGGHLCNSGPIFLAPSPAYCIPSLERTFSPFCLLPPSHSASFPFSQRGPARIRAYIWARRTVEY